jgi:hypothetical protein
VFGGGGDDASGSGGAALPFDGNKHTLQATSPVHYSRLLTITFVLPAYSSFIRDDTTFGCLAITRNPSTKFAPVHHVGARFITLGCRSGNAGLFNGPSGNRPFALCNVHSDAVTVYEHS